MKNIAILGSTGSIGQSTLSVVADNPDKFNVRALAAGTNHELLLNQINQFRPDMVAMSDPDAAAELARHTDIEVLQGVQGVCNVAAMAGLDFVVSAIVGAAGLEPTLEAVKAGYDIGLANKETMVVAGDIVYAEAKKSGSRILPVDSEHSAVFQCLNAADGQPAKRIILTASGGPFVGIERDQLSHITPDQALKHPSWSMGRKISIDSATLMNKGLEVIEAYHLFEVLPEQIDVVVHPQSIVHSMVEFADNSVIAQMSVPDMRGAIAYAMSYPARMDSVIERLNLAEVGTLTFRQPDMQSFPCLGYAYDALRAGGTMPAVLNAANEVAVDGFLDGKVGFNDIADIINETMQNHKVQAATQLETVLDAHSWAERHALDLINTKKVT